jgi:outer membrane murein-binding lipoprotein Lpp
MRPLRLLIVSSAILAGTACENPRAQAAVAQALNDAANEIGGLKNDVAQLQSDVDSLRQVVARQDSAITRIVAGLPR